MFYVFLSICCSVIVSILLKLAKRYHIDVLQAITWNYSTAILLTGLFFKPQLHFIQSVHSNIYLLLGILLPVLFLIIAASVRLTGIVRTDVAQRLSLLIPICAAFLLFHERLNSLKVVGIIVGFVAIVCSIPWQKQRRGKKAGGASWLYLLGVFVGFGIIDILFKQISLFKDVPYTTSLFFIYILAFIISLLFLAVQIYRKKTRFSWPHILIGWVLGIVNFGNILFYIKAHRALANAPSTVFAAMNIGVVVLATLVGLIVFKEKLSLLNKIGIGLAIIAIVVITNS
ncbi:MAG: EamA/RhaT family transporter [Mucilaginibacter sp.]|nr:EamA/RhaT family transporter [Mucilaginibacter sp.]